MNKNNRNIILKLFFIFIAVFYLFKIESDFISINQYSNLPVQDDVELFTSDYKISSFLQLSYSDLSGIQKCELDFKSSKLYNEFYELHYQNKLLTEINSILHSKNLRNKISDLRKIFTYCIYSDDDLPPHNC